MRYVEQYDVPCFPDAVPKVGRRMVAGIEEGSNFMGGGKGYACWYGGCGIGTAPTLSEARAKLHAHIIAEAQRHLLRAKFEIDFYNGILERLGTEERNLIKFPPVEVV